MSSKGNSHGSNGRSHIGFGDLLLGGSPVLGEVSHPRFGFESNRNSTAALASAATAVARVQDEIDDLWRHAMRIDNGSLSERLVEVSHALQRAARLLEEDRAIG